MRLSLSILIMVFLMGSGLPVLAQYSGEYDVGGGNMDFGSPRGAASLISINGVTGPVICNIYSGSMWSGTLNFPHNIPGISPVNTITFRNAAGHSPVLTAPYHNDNIVRMHCADYINIEGLEFTGCEAIAILIEGSESDSCHNIRIIGNYIHDIGSDTDIHASGIALAYTTDCEIVGNEIDGDYMCIYLGGSNHNLVANNMLYSVRGYFVFTDYHPGYVIYEYECQENRIYHNSGFNSGDYIIAIENCTNSMLHNNILFQSGEGSGFGIVNWYNSPIVSDYNDIYAPDAYVGRTLAGNCSTLTDWQIDTGLDDNSISADPNFTSTITPLDLHVLEPSSVGYAGIYLPEVPEDFDGETRKPNPDLGADEFIHLMAGSFDVGGGNNDFATVIEAAERIESTGISGPVTFNVYSGTYNGQVNLPNIAGTSPTSTVKFQAVSGQTPVITNTTGTLPSTGNGFYLTGADHITIQGFEITNCYADGIRNYYDGADSSKHNVFKNNYIHNIGTGGDYAGVSLHYGAQCEVRANEINGDEYGIDCRNGNNNLIANNMIYYCTDAGLHDDQGSDNLYYYNTVYQESIPAITYCFYEYHGSNLDLKNNILYHSGVGTHYTVSFVGNLSSFPIISDYNDLYAPDAYIGYYNGDQTTLANWQTATGLDANSLSVDPNFISLATPDLHCNSTSPLDMSGIPLPEVSDDFDGDSRNTIHPDIGADEFYPPMAGVYDVGGGAMHYATLTEAINHLNGGGMAGPVTLNTYTGTYSGLTLDNTISGLGSANPLVIQNAPGESPIIQSFFGYGIRIDFADYITIQGFTIRRCYFDGIRVNGSSADSCSHIQIFDNYIYDVAEQGLGHYNGIYLNCGQDCQVIGNDIDGYNQAYTGMTVRNSASNLIANNMVYNCTSTGINSTVCANDFYYYNSVFIGRNCALYLDNATNPTVKNNILYQTGSNRCALYIADSLTTFPVISDYNDLYAPNGCVGHYFSNITDLASWQTATGLDANSISADPNFVSNTDLHVNTPSLVDSAGIPVAEVTVDFDGDTRHTVTPDIGADEVGIAGHPEPVEDLVITLTSSTDESTDVILFWSPALNAQQYHIYKSTTNPGSGFTLLGSTTDITYTDTSAIIDETKSYYYITTDNQSLDSRTTGINFSRKINRSTDHRE